MAEQRVLRVLTIGPAPAGPHSRGGMASVMTLMANHPDRHIAMRVVPTYVDGSAFRKLFVGLRGMVVASTLILFGRVDVLHVHLSHGGSVIRKGLPLTVARVRGIPTVVHAHSYDFAGWLGGSQPLVRWMAGFVLTCDRWVVLGSSHVESFSAILNLPCDQFMVLHNPVVLPGDETPADIDAGDLMTVVSLGRLGVRKGSYDIVAAVAAMPADVRLRMRVVLAGDGEISEVSAAVRAAGVADVVDVRGWLEPAERDQLISRAQVFLLPSYDEGLPMALLESMAQGLAPIVSPVGGIPNVVTDGREGLLVPAGDIAAISAALTMLTEDPEQRQRLRSAARARSKDFDISRWYARLADLWLNLDRQRRG